MPSQGLLTVADSHNVAFGAEQSLLENLGEKAASVAKFVGLSVAAGVNDISNIPATVGNLFGGDFQIDTMEDRLVGYDNNLLQYYEDHKTGIDTAGFIAGSLVPGTGGVKVFNAGAAALKGATATGRFGATTAKAVELLVPARETALATAIKELGSAGNVFSIGNANTLKTIAAGFHEQALQAFAFETAVAATMHNSPILSEMDASDLAVNVAIGTAFGGVVGGALSGAGAVYKMKKAVSGIQKDLHPWSMTYEPPANFTAAEKAISWRYQIDNLPQVADDFALKDRALALRSQTETAMWTKVQESLNDFAGGDHTLAKALLEEAKTGSADDFMKAFMHGSNVGRLTSRTHAEAEIAALNKKAMKEGIQSLTPEEAARFTNSEVTFVRLHGEGTERGAVMLEDRPSILSITDRFNKIEFKEDGMYNAGKKIFNQENNPHRPFNIMGLDHMQVESRYFWAERLAKWTPENNVIVHETDIPLLEKALRDLDEVRVIPEGGKIDEAYKLIGKDQMREFVVRQKHNIAERLAQRVTSLDPQTIADKLMSHFGVTVNISDEAGFWGRWSQKTDANGVRWDAIELSKTGLARKNLLSIVQTLEHERGHMQFQAMLRGLTSNFKDPAVLMRPGMPTDLADRNYAAMIKDLVPELTKVSKRARPLHWKEAMTDIEVKEYLTQAHELMADSFAYFALHPEKLDKFPQFKAYAGHLIRPIPQEIKDAMTVRATKLSQEEIAKIVNVRSGNLDGSAFSQEGYFARDLDRAAYMAKREAAGTRAGEAVADPLLLPKHAKIVTNTASLRVNGYEVDGIAHLAAKEQLYRENAQRVVTANLGEDALSLPKISKKQLIAEASEGPGVMATANADYGTGGSVFSFIGQRTHAMISKMKTATGEVLTPVMHKLANDLDGAVEWSVLNERVRMSPYRYRLVDDMLVADVPAEKLADLMAAGDEFAQISIKNSNALEAVKAHMALNAKRQAGLSTIDKMQNVGSRRVPEHFYPIPRNPADTPHFAYVIDDTITGVGHSQMIYAKDAQALEVLKQHALTEKPHLKVLTKAESEAYFKAHGQFDFERTMNEKLIDATKSRLGTSASYLPKTDPAKIVQETMEWHYARDAAFVRSNISALYQPEFEALYNAGHSATQAAKSKFGYIAAVSHAENAAANPHSDLVKMALDVSKKDELPFWTPLNKMADEFVSKVWNSAREAFAGIKGEHELEAVQAALSKAGYKGVLPTDETALRALNATVPRGTLTTFVNKANAMIATFALRLDPLNALNNLVGSQVLVQSELRSLLRNIEAANGDAAGELAKLAFIKEPSKGNAILSPTKLIANSIKRFHTDAEARAWAKANGFTTTISEQYDQSLDIMAASIRDTNASVAFQKLKDLGNFGEKWTGNSLAEEMNRFVAADVMKQITDVAVKHGVLGEKEALAYVNTFVNRTQGNYLASQRPLVFQGALGQAIGLFQTYQFNLIQQLLRYVGEGDKKAVLTMMGLQGSIYGMQGLPAFNAINTHIIGNMIAGNPNHRDVYKTIYETAGPDAGDWIMYGGLSNLPGLVSADLKNNMYTRGDVNPRHLFVIPTSPSELPIYQASAKVLGNIFDTIGNATKSGEVVQSLLRGLEHNGVSRPLAGLAQVLEGLGTGNVEATSNSGNILMQHDLANWASLTRLLGGKPLDEAVMQDAMFRVNAYKAKDRSRKEALGEAIKMNVYAGKEISEDQMTGFMESYLNAGGKQTEFNQFMMRQYRNAEIPQAEQLRKNLASPYSKALQVMMGGQEQ